MTHTDKLVEVALALRDKIEDKKDDLNFFNPAIKGVWYGDQTKLPVVPAVCVEPGIKQRQLAAAQYFSENVFEVHILLYYTQIGTSEEIIRRTVDQLAEAVEALVHLDPQLNNGVPGQERVIHGFIRELESGYTYRDRTLYRSAHLTYQGRSKTRLR